jgi:sugar phosphate isomerase/epimerase
MNLVRDADPRLAEHAHEVSVRAFAPAHMKVGILTAALQELTPRGLRDADPDRAIEDWIEFARDLGVDGIQLSAALHPDETDVPPDAMLDPVANTLDLRTPFDGARAARVQRALASARLSISDLGYFDNMLHGDAAIRRAKHAFMLRVFDAAVQLGVNAVCGFVGRNQTLTLDQNLRDFGQGFIPILTEARRRGLTYRVEPCPMPGWDAGDNFHNNIGYTPGAWIELHRICEAHGVGDTFRIHYDPSHAILMGQDSRSVFQFLRERGYQFLIAGFHVKGQVIDAKGVSAWGYGGQTMGRGGAPIDAWKKQTVLAEHELPGTARHDPLAYLQNRTVDWLDHQLAARELLQLDVANTPLVVEHEFPPARIQDRERLKPILQGSIEFIRRIDQAAAAMYALQSEVLPSQDIPVQGRGRDPYRS